MSTPVSLGLRRQPLVGSGAVDASVDSDVDVDVDVLVVGAGATGLGTAAFLDAAARAGALPKAPRTLVIERDGEVGGYCRTVVRDGFVFDYAGHFFHFKDPAIHAFVAERLPPGALRSIIRRAAVIDVFGDEVAFPYQAHVRQLPHQAAVRCLVDLWAAENRLGECTTPTTFSASLQARLGRGLVERFLRPYNEKLYATSLDALDVDCMGRFFPQVRFDHAIDEHPASASFGYNAVFTYPTDGAITYIKALMRDLGDDVVATDEGLVAVDLDAHVAVTSRRRIRYRAMVSSAPLPQLLSMTTPVLSTPSPSRYSWNKVLVFNLGFDKKGRDDVHWLYVAQPDVPFYRVGFYDVISDGPRMSLYVEVGLPSDAAVDAAAIADWRARCLQGLRQIGIISDHRLVAEHHVVMNPAYVHISPQAIRAADEAIVGLAAHHVYSVGRYGAWTYCSIEDNLLAAKALVDGPLAALLSTTPAPRPT